MSLLPCTGLRKQNTTLYYTRSTRNRGEYWLTQRYDFIPRNLFIRSDMTLVYPWLEKWLLFNLLLLLSPLPSVSLLFKYKPAAAGQPDSAILFEDWPYCGHQECLRVIWEQTHNYTITLTVMLAVKYWCFILLALIKADPRFCFGGPQTPVTSGTCSPSFRPLLPPLCETDSFRARGQSTHVLTSRGLVVGWRRCADSSHIRGGEWAPVSVAAVQTSRPTTTNSTRVRACVRMCVHVCVSACTCLRLHQRSHARHIWCNSGSRDQYVISENTLPYPCPFTVEEA